MTNPTQKLIEDAIAGGWKPHDFFRDRLALQLAVLDPAFWQAVGKTRGWENETRINPFPTYWQDYMHRMIDHLAEGKSLESFIEQL